MRPYICLIFFALIVAPGDAQDQLSVQHSDELPPWQTWWALTSYGFVLLAILFLARRDVIRRERLRNEIKMKRLETQTYQELDALKSRLFANISHEFRTPLTLILAPIRKKIAAATSVEERTELKLIEQNAQRLLKLVNELLDLSRLEAGKLSLRPSNDDLVAICSLTTRIFSSFAESRNIKLSFECTADEVVVRLDAEKFEKVLGNLITNAIKFTPDGGTVHVSVSKHRSDALFPYGHAEVVVADSGIGIPASEQPKIFNRFYQVDSSITRTYEGTGIGLALAKEIIELHQGTIDVGSEPGSGSKFTVRLPLSDGRPPMLRPEQKEEQVHKDVGALLVESDYAEDDEEALTTDLHPQTLLIVEDHAELRHYIQQSFSTNYNVLTAADGEQGKKIALDSIPDLVITDLMLPKLDGFGLCSFLKNDEKTSHIPVVMLTARDEIKSRIEGFETGADDYIAKPFNFEELNVRVKNLLDSRKRLREKFSQQIVLGPRPVEAMSLDDQFLQKIMTIVEENIANTSFGVDMFARAVAMSSAQLYRKVTALTNYSPNDFIRQMRLQRAADLLRQRAGNVADVAYQAGFTSLSYFSKCFRQKFGVVPSEYAKSAAENTPRPQA